MKDVVHLVGVALQFLTRLPVPSSGFREDDLRRSMGAFPLVGAVVAGIGTGVYWLARLFWDGSVTAVVAVAAMVLVTGALHEDGLADTADGLWGGQTPQRRLEIMRDSRLGTYGTIALALTLGVRVSLLAGLPVLHFARVVVVGHVLGRASSVLLTRLCPALPGGSGAKVARGPGPVGSSFAALVAVGAAVGVLGPPGAVPLAVGALVTIGSARLFKRRLGGINGDTLGATNQVVHVSSMAVTVALLAA